MGDNRENKDTSSFQSNSDALIHESVGTQMKEKASNIDPTPSAEASVSANPLGGTISFTTSATVGCISHATEKEYLIWRNQFSGYIFMCNGKTKADCYRCRVFGLPAARMNIVEKIRPRMTLFLFDFDLKLLYGIYTAASNGGLGIEPTAFGGKFLAQVKFEISRDCLPLPERLFKHAIRDNYSGGFKFRRELSKEQVANLISLFHPISIPPPMFAETKPVAQISASFDQYRAEDKVTHFGLHGSLGHNQPAWCHGGSYIPQQKHPPYVPENIALLQNDAHNSELGHASHSHVAMSQAAAYWAAVASEDREVVGSCEGRVLPIKSFLGDTSASVSTSSIFYPSVQENGGTRTSHFVLAASNDMNASKTFRYQTPSYGGRPLPASSGVRFSDNSELACYKPNHGLPLESASVEAGALSPPYSTMTGTVSHASVPQNTANELNMLAACTHASNYDSLAYAAKASPARYVQVPQQISTSSYGYAHSLAASGRVAYWNGNAYVNYSSRGALITDGTSQANWQVPLQVPAPCNAAAYLHYPDGASFGE